MPSETLLKKARRQSKGKSGFGFNRGSQPWIHIRIIWRALKILMAGPWLQRFEVRWSDVGPRQHNVLKVIQMILMYNQG